MQFFLYRHPLYDEETPVCYGVFETYLDAKQELNKVIDDDWYFYEDFYIVESSNG